MDCTHQNRAEKQIKKIANLKALSNNPERKKQVRARICKKYPKQRGNQMVKERQLLASKSK